jgi:hypothetical protein
MKLKARPVGLKSAPKRVPRKLRGTSDLRALQRLFMHALVQPLAPGNRLAFRISDGRKTAEIAEALIKPNDRLTSVERLEIYARCYWFRIIDSVYEDCPGLRALVGEKRFAPLVRAFVAKYPSRSFTLRNLCQRLPQFLAEEPQWTAPHTELAITIARFEWAQTVAFDGESRPPLSPDDIADAPPHRLRFGLQPYLTLLAVDWPVDDYVIAVKRREAMRAEASNAVDGSHQVAVLKRVTRPRRERCYIGVHRHNNRLYYKRITAPEYAVLSALGAGGTIPQALAAANTAITPEQVRDWFATWTELRWLCKRENRTARK